MWCWTLTALLQAGAPVDIRNKKRLTALMLASNQGHEECVKVLLKAGAKPLAAQPETHLTALHMAAKAGQAAVVRQLLGTLDVVRATTHASKEPGKDPFVVIEWGQGSARRRRVISAKEYENSTLAAGGPAAGGRLARSASYAIPAAGGTLREGSGDTDAACAGEGGVVARGVGVLSASLGQPNSGGRVETTARGRTRGKTLWINMRARGGESPLIMAAGAGAPAVVRLLLQAGAKLHAITLDPVDGEDVSRHRMFSLGTGNTALHYAAAGGSKDCVQLLLLYGADATARNDDNRTPLDLCRAFGKQHLEGILGDPVMLRLLTEGAEVPRTVHLAKVKKKSWRPPKAPTAKDATERGLSSSAEYHDVTSKAGQQWQASSASSKAPNAAQDDDVIESRSPEEAVHRGHASTSRMLARSQSYF
eukprot:jgi/Mesvir1/10788/Mv13843-RA.1